MSPSRLKRTIPGIALIFGLVTGTALAMVPSSSEAKDDASAAPVGRICSFSCKPCLTNEDCGPDEGRCANQFCP